MAWINKNNFDILQTLQEKQSLNDYFEVDDAIALPIAELNRKGIETINSCAGHPFPIETIIDAKLSEKTFTVEELMSELFDGDKGEEKTLQFRTYISQRAYVGFRNPLPDGIEPPEGWRYDADGQAIYFHYEKTTNPYLFMKSQLQQMLNLLKWVASL